MKKLLIFGATSLARLAHYYAVNDLGLNVLAFVVDEAYKSEDRFLSLPVLTWEQACVNYSTEEVFFFVSIGYKSMRLRAASYARVKAAGYKFVNIISNDCYVAKGVVSGDNNIIMPGAVVEPGVVMGSNNIIWSNATICHDCKIGDHNFIASNVTIGGEVNIGDQNFLGFSSTVIQQIIIGNETLIGAQTLITRNTTDASEYRGSPARKVSLIDVGIGVTV
ncbi:MAG: acetyltransferase [Methylobacter sp.]